MQEISYCYYGLVNSDITDSDKEKYKAILTDKMRAALKMYRKSAGVTLKNDKLYYEIAHPRAFRYYWLIHSVFGRLKGERFDKEN